MTRARASSAGTRVGLDPFASSARRPKLLAVVPALSERRRTDNRRSLGLVSDLRCECTLAGCRETVPAAADAYRGTTDCFIVAPAHLNGDTPLRVADHFFVISRSERR